MMYRLLLFTLLLFLLYFSFLFLFLLERREKKERKKKRDGKKLSWKENDITKLWVDVDELLMSLCIEGKSVKISTLCAVPAP